MKNIDYTDEFLLRRKERQKKARKRRLIAWFIFIMIILLAVGVILSFTVLFPIKKIDIKGSEIYTSKQIISVSDIEIGDNLFNISEKKLLNKLRAKLPFVEGIKIERSLPDTLKITVTDAQRYACYEVKDKYYTVSKDGWVLEENAEKTQNVFLVISKDVVCSVGEQLINNSEKSKKQIEELIKYLNEKNIVIDYINVTNSVNLRIGVEGRFDVILGSDNSLEEKINYLKAMIAEIDKSKSGTINLSMLNNQNSHPTFVENNTN